MVCVWLVFEILLAFAQNHDWELAFTSVIPERKVLTQKLVTDEDSPESSPELVQTADVSDLVT